MIPVGLATGARGVAVTGHALATEAALAELRAGGNAVDAAIAAAFVLNVVEPYATTLGGDAFVLVFEPATRGLWGLNGSGGAPWAAERARYPADLPRTGILSLTVPGVVRALGDLHARFATRPWTTLVEPAIALAREGFTVDAGLEGNARERAATLREDPVAAAMFLPGGNPIAAGTVLRQAALATTLAVIAREGADGFHRGPLADRLAGEILARGGLIAADDLARHQSLWQEPIRAPFHGHEVATMPPNSYGLTLLLQLLELERGAIASVDPDSAAFVLRGLAARAAAYKASGRVIGDPALAPAAAEILARAPHGAPMQASASMPRGGGTTNVITWDARGMVVSLVESISMPFGSGVVLPETGILMNNRLRGFADAPDHPNALAPGKRPAHTLTPAMVLKDDKPALALGTPGSVGQTCVLAQILCRMLAHGQDPRQAIAAPRWSMDFQGTPIVEQAMDQAMVEAVRHDTPSLKTLRTGWQTFGSVMIARPRAEGGLEGAADSRRSASAGAL
jgi:gamma-glutamyltranspeptidase/glutathione hydrolase